MTAARDTATIRIPGSTSNCGAGFDTLGLALSIHNDVTLTRASGSTARPAKPGDERAQAMVDATAAAFFADTRVPAFGFSFHVHGDVPAARGLGSSVTVRAGIVAGLARLAGIDYDRRDIVSLVTALEGHPDNAAAAVFGGFCVARSDPENGDYLDAVRFDVPSDLTFVVASPQVEVLTKESRGALPKDLPYFDAVKSINSAAYVVAAFASRDFAKLRGSVHDLMHEPYRLPGIPGGRAAIDAGIGAGAFTGWLSGSGSSVLCVTIPAAAATVGKAMQAAFRAARIECEIRRLSADNQGLRLV